MEPVAEVPHPLVDEVRNGVVLSRADGPVVALTPLRADLIRATAEAGVRLVLVTPAGARLTAPLVAVLAEAGAGWAAEREGGGWYDGRSGRPLDAPELVLDRFDAPPVPEFLRIGIGAAPQVAVSLSLRHRADTDTRLGRAVTELAGAVGGAPAGWGPHEPVEQPWSEAALTAFARSASPAEIRLVVAGHGHRPLAGSVLVRRTDRGVEEVVDLVLGLGPGGSSAPVQEALARLAATGMPLAALALERDGEPDLTVRPTAQRPASPAAVLIGAPAVRDLGLDPAALARTFEGRIVGRPRLPALLVPLDGDRGGWRTLALLIDRIGPDRLRRATGVRLGEGA